MNAFAEEFLDRQAHRWNPRTRKTNSRIVRENILLTFGNLTVDAITVKHVGDWFAALSERPGIANRAVPVPSMLMRMAGLWGYRVHNSNPCKSTRHYKMKPKERYLTPYEIARLNALLTRDEFWCSKVVAIVRLLMLTRCHKSECSDYLRRDSSTGCGPQAARSAHSVTRQAPNRSGNRPRITARQPRTSATRRSSRRTASRRVTPAGVRARGWLSSAAAATPARSASSTSASSSTRVPVRWAAKQSGSREKVCGTLRQYQRAIFAGPQGVYRL